MQVRGKFDSKIYNQVQYFHYLKQSGNGSKNLSGLLFTSAFKLEF